MARWGVNEARAAWACALLVGWMMASCGGKPGRAKSVDDKSVDEYPSYGESGVGGGEQVNDGTLKFDEEAAEIALKRGARKVKNCSKTAQTPAGEGEVIVKFDGAKGRVVDVDVGSMWSDASDQAKRCIVKSFVGEYVPPFEGNKDMPLTITIPEPGGDEK